MNTLRSLRERKGLSISQLAARASIPARIINEYEEGKQTIPLPHAKLIAKALWVQIEELLPPGGVGPYTSVQGPTQIAAQPEAPMPQPQDSRQQTATLSPTERVTTQVTTAQSEPSAPPPTPQAQGDWSRASETAVRPEEVRPARAEAHDTTARPRPAGPARDRRGDARGGSLPKPASPPPSPVSSGQVEELGRLAARLEIQQEALEERIGKPIAALNRPDAKEWIKRLRAMAEEIAPGQRVRYGQWPEAREDQEAGYLREQKEAEAPFLFKLFNGEQVEGVVKDFTPYTITVQTAGTSPDGATGVIVLRKLAVAYYRQLGEGRAAAGSQSSDVSRQSSVEVARHDHERDDRRQALQDDLLTDHVGNPDVPEEDNMDDDRGV